MGVLTEFEEKYQKYLRLKSKFECFGLLEKFDKFWPTISKFDDISPLITRLYNQYELFGVFEEVDRGEGISKASLKELNQSWDDACEK